MQMWISGKRYTTAEKLEKTDIHKFSEGKKRLKILLLSTSYSQIVDKSITRGKRCLCYVDEKYAPDIVG